MRDDLALTGMLGAGARVEETALDGDERIVEIGLERAVAVCVDDLQRIGIAHGNVVGRYLDELAC